jgi:hypothetical protein
MAVETRFGLIKCLYEGGFKTGDACKVTVRPEVASICNSDETSDGQIGSLGRQHASYHQQHDRYDVNWNHVPDFPEGACARYPDHPVIPPEKPKEDPECETVPLLLPKPSVWSEMKISGLGLRAIWAFFIFDLSLSALHDSPRPRGPSCDFRIFSQTPSI